MCVFYILSYTILIWYVALGHDKAQSIIDQITAAYETSGGPPPGGFGFGPQHLAPAPAPFGGPPMGFPPPPFGGSYLARETDVSRLTIILGARPPFPPGMPPPGMMPPGGPPFPPGPGMGPPGMPGFPPNGEYPICFLSRLWS